MRLDRFQRAALLTTLTTYALIAVGGLVRASGAGLGCPDWPMCFGLLIPPLDASGLPPGFDPADFNVFKTWTEYINRLIGAITGLLILWTAALAVLDHRKNRSVLWPTIGAFLLVLTTGWLGAKVVRSGLDPRMLTLHLVFALLVVSFLLYATVSAFYPAGPSAAPRPEQQRVGWLTLGAIVVLLIQVGFGAFVRGEVQRVAETGAPRATWLAQVGLIETLHQSFAIFVAAAVVGSAALAWRLKERVTQRAATASIALVLGQAFAGLGLTTLGFPRSLQVLHLLGSSLLIGALTLQAMLAWRVGPSRP